jgi:hypothetical protein
VLNPDTDPRDGNALALSAQGMWCILMTLVHIGGAAAVPPPSRLPQPLQELIRTEVVYPQEKHETQVTFVSALDRHREGHTFSLPLHLEYGLTDAWQVELEWVSYQREAVGDVPVQGTGDLGFGSKYSFMRIGGSNLHAAIGIDVERGLERDLIGVTSHDWNATPFVAAAFDLPPHVQLFGQAGGTWSLSTDAPSTNAASDTPSDSGAFVNAGALVALRHVTLATELNWVPTPDGRAIYVTPSATMHFGHCCELGVGVSAGLNSAADRYSFVVQFIAEK